MEFTDEEMYEIHTAMREHVERLSDLALTGRYPTIRQAARISLPIAREALHKVGRARSLARV